MLKIPLILRSFEQHDGLALTFSVLPVICAVACAGAIVFPGSLFAAEEKVEFPAASQHAVVKQRVGLTDVEIDYSRPNKNNRDIFGGLVPFDKPWRTGANQPTKIKTSAPIKLGDKEVPAGEYVLYTIPGANEWTIVFSKNLKAQSLTDHKPEDEAVRITAKPVALATPAETFTIGFEDLRANSATLYLEWDKTRVPVKWVDQALEKNPKVYFMHYKRAQILGKMGSKKEAIAAAEKSIEILQVEPNPDESAIRTSRALIDSLR